MNNPKVHLFNQAFSTSPTSNHPQTKRSKARIDASDEDSPHSSSSSSSSEDDPIRPRDFPIAPLKRIHSPIPSTPSAKNPSHKAHPPTRHQRNVKHQHSTVLNAILHKAVLSGDFERAERAFALLVRVELRGKRVDLRRGGLWGVGGEILSRRGQHGMEAGARDVDRDHEGDYAPMRIDAGSGGAASEIQAGRPTLLPRTRSNSQRKERTPYPTSPHALADTRRYYERLALQYPYRRHRPHDVDERTFWPIIYSFEIYHLQGEVERARRESGAVSADGDGSLGQEGNLTRGESEEAMGREVDATSSSDDENETDENQHTSTSTSIPTNKIEPFLPRITALAQQLTTRNAIPPYNRDATLLKMEGDLWSWVADLFVECGRGEGGGDGANGHDRGGSGMSWRLEGGDASGGQGDGRLDVEDCRMRADRAYERLERIGGGGGGGGDGGGRSGVTRRTR